MKEGVYDVAFRKKRLPILYLRKSNLNIKSEIDAEQSHLLSKLHYFSRCYEFLSSQGMRTQIFFPNFNEKKIKTVFGFISRKNYGLNRSKLSTVVQIQACIRAFYLLFSEVIFKAAQGQ